MTGAPRHDLHQHDLDATVAATLVNDAEVQPGDQVLEVGAGTGAITAALLQAGARVVAWEFDRDRCAALRQRFADAGSAFSLYQGNAVGRVLAGDWRVVANPPFNRTADFMQAWLLSPTPPRRIDCLWQHQAAAKWCAAAPDATVSGLLAHSLGVPRVVKRHPRGVTKPASAVDLCHFAWSSYTVADTETDAASPSVSVSTEVSQGSRQLPCAIGELFAWWRHAFAGPHTLREALRGHATTAILKKQAAKHGWSPDDHPRVLTIDAWLDLLGYLHSIGRVPPGATQDTPGTGRHRPRTARLVRQSSQKRSSSRK
jgi:23S rRNA (adenine-N6)-dimethyltransferase